MSKIIQITACAAASGDRYVGTVIALNTEGEVYEIELSNSMDKGWTKFPPLPQAEDKEKSND